MKFGELINARNAAKAAQKTAEDATAAARATLVNAQAAEATTDGSVSTTEGAVASALTKVQFGLIDGVVYYLDKNGVVSSATPAGPDDDVPDDGTGTTPPAGTDLPPAGTDTPAGTATDAGTSPA